jgi:iron complex transport system ATP-binding protein
MSERPAGIDIRSVSVRRGQRVALDAVSLSVARGEVLALVGPNGAGKSTLISAVSGDLKLAGGEIDISAKPVGSMSLAALARQRAVYAVGRTAPPGFTAQEVVEMGRNPVPYTSADEEREIVTRMMQATDTVGIAHRDFATLSEGERSRVGLARVFAQQTPVLLLDEPTASLDVRHQHQVMDHVRAVAAEGASVIAAVHDLNLACMYADRIAMIREGRIVAEGTPNEVMTSELLEAVFECPMAILPHPYRPIPIVLPYAEPGRAEPEANDQEEHPGDSI